MFRTKTILLILIAIFCSGEIIISQQYEIVYSLRTSFSSGQNEFVYNQLISNDISYTEFDNDATNLLKSQDLSYDKTAPKPYVLYLPEEGHITYTAYVQSKNFILREKTPLVDWKMTGEKKYILGHSCQKATTSFRGRLYSLWLTTELGVIGGVWKFVGLPGYVMAASSDDGEVEYSVQSIKLSDKAIPNKESIVGDNQNIITWGEYETLFKKYRKRLEKYIAAESDEDIDMTLKQERVEIIEH
jgi:GLPGLI family protein